MKIPTEHLLEISVAAGAGILRIRQSGLLQETAKGDSSPVTEADIWAHEFISKSLQNLSPSIPVISEEFEYRDVPDDFWLVDPLDGTKEFIRGFDDFTVNIARVRNNRPIFGVVALPATGSVYFGGRNYSTRVLDGVVERELRVAALHEPAIIAVSRSHSDDLTEQFCSRFESHVRVPAGSSMKFCLIAEGRADYYPRFGRTMEWDTAAGQAVLEGAGGRVLAASTLDDMTYGKVGLENPGFIAVGPAEGVTVLKQS